MLSFSIICEFPHCFSINFIVYYTAWVTNIAYYPTVCSIQLLFFSEIINTISGPMHQSKHFKFCHNFFVGTFYSLMSNCFTYWPSFLPSRMPSSITFGSNVRVKSHLLLGILTVAYKKVWIRGEVHTIWKNVPTNAWHLLNKRLTVR